MGVKAPVAGLMAVAANGVVVAVSQADVQVLALWIGGNCEAAFAQGDLVFAFELARVGIHGKDEQLVVRRDRHVEVVAHGVIVLSSLGFR